MAPHEPKKRPRQERSRLTVDYILDAAAQILSRDGRAKLTTNQIAERAGVAVASLYQYFPNKEAIVNALVQLHLAEEHAEFAARSEQLRDRPLREVIRVGVLRIIAVHARKPSLVKSVLEAIPLLGMGEALVRARRQVIDLVRDTIRVRSREVRRPEHPELKAFVVVHAVESIVHAAATEHPEWLNDPDFAEEIVDLVDRFVLEG